MAVKLRLRRTGTRNKPCFRVVAADSRSPRDGRFIEVIGFYDPRKQDERIDLERVDYWLSNGAQPSPTVKHIIDRVKDGRKLAVPTPKTPPPAEAPAEEAAAEEDKKE